MCAYLDSDITYVLLLLDLNYNYRLHVVVTVTSTTTTRLYRLVIVATAGDFSLDLGFLSLVWGSGDFFGKSAFFWGFFGHHGIYIFFVCFLLQYHGFCAILQWCEYNNYNYYRF